MPKVTKLINVFYYLSTDRRRKIQMCITVHAIVDRKYNEQNETRHHQIVSEFVTSFGIFRYYFVGAKYSDTLTLRKAKAGTPQT